MARDHNDDGDQRTKAKQAGKNATQWTEYFVHRTPHTHTLITGMQARAQPTIAYQTREEKTQGSRIRFDYIMDNIGKGGHMHMKRRGRISRTERRNEVIEKEQPRKDTKNEK